MMTINMIVNSNLPMTIPNDNTHKTKLLVSFFHNTLKKAGITHGTCHIKQTVFKTKVLRHD